MLEIHRLSALDDNYIWLLHDPASGQTIVIDPPEADIVLQYCIPTGWAISHVWVTHWHPDHVGGVAALKAATGCIVIGPLDVEHPVPALDRVVDEGDRLAIGATRAAVLSTPGHTKVHLTYHIPDAMALFTGDTLFALGIGRLFEGTAEQMFDNMQRFRALPAKTRVYCAHEYTLGNGRFALSVEPDNAALIARMRDVEVARAKGLPTVPSTIEDELATNPFMRAASASILGERRAAKDSFKA